MPGPTEFPAPAIQYRQADPSDISAIAGIRTLGGWEGGASEDRMLQYLAGNHHPRQALMPRVIYVASDGDSLVGFVAGHLTQRYGCDGELQWIYVVPARRGSDVAAELLRLMARWFATQNASRVCVDVEPHNAVARRFYTRLAAEQLNPHWLVWRDISVVLSMR